MFPEVLCSTHKIRASSQNEEPGGGQLSLLRGAIGLTPYTCHIYPIYSRAMGPTELNPNIL